MPRGGGGNGGVAERTNAAVLKTVGRREASRGFESLPLRSSKQALAATGRRSPCPVCNVHRTARDDSGRVIDGREHLHDLYAWDEFWS
jgi:hypothetical protein